MIAQTFKWSGAVLFFITFMVGCASSSDSENPTSGQTARNEQCRLNPGSCMYEGAYEVGEREYAEQRAKELNRASAQKLRRRSGGWW